MAAARRGPREFKRGLPKLTHREREAAVLSGALVDETVKPEQRQQLETILRSIRGTSIHEGPVIEAVASAFQLWREREEADKHALALQEQAQQAHVTAAVLREAVDRLVYADPQVAAMAAGIHWTEHRKLLTKVVPQLAPTLEAMASSYDLTAERLAALHASTGPTPNPERARALRTVMTALKDHSTPALTRARARPLAAELLTACGMPFPAAPHELRKLEASS